MKRVASNEDKYTGICLFIRGNPKSRKPETGIWNQKPETGIWNQKPESGIGTGNQKPESGIRNPQIKENKFFMFAKIIQ